MITAANSVDAGDGPPFLAGAIGVAVGAWMAIGTGFRSYLHRRNTCYALTNRRAIILHGLGRLRLRDMPITESTPLEIVFGKYGTIWLGARPTSSDATQSAVHGAEPGGFVLFSIPQVDTVLSLIPRIQKGEA